MPLRVPGKQIFPATVWNSFQTAALTSIRRDDGLFVIAGRGAPSPMIVRHDSLPGSCHVSCVRAI
jgi:hypothetical protein